MQATLHTDGGARGNPGPGGIGVVLRARDGEVLGELAAGIGIVTNNVAEYKALIAGLEMALARGVSDVAIHMDSKLVLEQLQGNWKIKNDTLRALAVEARRLANRFDNVTFTLVPREHNADADALANQGMDAAALDVQLDSESSQTLFE